MAVHRGVRYAAGVLVASAAYLALPGAHALAAGANPVPPTLAGGTVAVTPCGSLAAATVHWTVRAGQVTAVTVSGLPATCAGGVLSAALVGLAGDLGDGSAVVGAGGTVAVTALSGSPAATAVGAVRFAVVGP